MLKGIFILNEKVADKVYGSRIRNEIEKYVDCIEKVYNKESIRQNLEILNDIEVIFSGWGGPKLDEELLRSAPNLRVIFFGGGSIKRYVTDEFWDRKILITSAYAANSVAVSEYTLSQILFCLKKGWYFAERTKKERKFEKFDIIPGIYGTTVGIVSLGMIGRRVCELLSSFDVNIIAYDPYISDETAKELGVELCSLDEIFERGDVVSLHSPWLKETEGMITGKHFLSMKANASFINTARGAVVREQEMIDVLKERTDIQAVLDVTYPEPPEQNSPLYTMANVVLTPHIAGSSFNECERMGKYMVEELERYVHGKPLKWQMGKEITTILA